MMILVIPGLYLLAGITAYAALHHYANAISVRRQPAQLIFSLLCMLTVPFAIFHAQALQAVDAGEFIRMLRWNLGSPILFFVLFPWFIAHFTGRIRLPILIGLNAFFATLFFANLVEPYTLQYDSFDRVRTLTLPWGEVVSRGVGHHGLWAYIGFAGAFVAFVYALVELISAYRRTGNRTMLAMSGAIGLFGLSAIQGLLTRLGYIDFIEPGPFGFLVVIIVMSVVLTHETQKKLKNSEKRFRSIVEESPVAISFSREGYTVDVNDAFLKLFGYGSVDEVRGTSVINRIAPQCRHEIEDRVRRRTEGLPVETTYETTGMRKDGSEFPLFISAKRLKLNDGPISSAFLIDFTERKQAEEKIKHLAYYDQLTGLPNRRLLMDRLQQALGSSMRSGLKGALLLIDLDNFKALNETMGHDIGDQLLKLVTERLTSCVREGDTVARFGGDEFVMLLVDLGGNELEAAAGSEATGEKIIAALNRPYFLANRELHVSCCVGAALFSDQQQSMEELMKQVDIAMNQAKKEGRNLLRFFDPRMQDIINARVFMEAELHKALKYGQFHLYYQVQVDSSGRALGAEGLIRWQHPQRGLILPDQFIPLAEETGLIEPIGQWAFNTVCAQLDSWQRNPLTRELVLSVNVSPKRFHSANFDSALRATIHRYGIDPKLLKLELTESMLVGDIDHTIVTMKSLKQTGLSISLDDFGTGYSSLQYLKQLPLDQLKIDQSFVRDIVVDDNDKAIVQTIISMAQSLELGVIAEGVETEAQRQILHSKGCRQFQGYQFGRPVPITEFEAQLSHYREGRIQSVVTRPS